MLFYYYYESVNWIGSTSRPFKIMEMAALLFSLRDNVIAPISFLHTPCRNDISQPRKVPQQRKNSHRSTKTFPTKLKSKRRLLYSVLLFSTRPKGNLCPKAPPFIFLGRCKTCSSLHKFSIKRLLLSRAASFLGKEREAPLPRDTHSPR